MQEPYPWFALKVRTRSEHLVSSALRGRGYDPFLPTYLDCRQYSDRIKKVQTALFPGYIFCRFDPERRLPILTTAGVDHVVSVAGVPMPVDETELEAVRRVVANGLPAIPWQHLTAGDRARIQFGSLAGIEGIVLSTRGVDRLILSVSLLQRSVSIEIDRAWIRPLRVAAAVAR